MAEIDREEYKFPDEQETSYEIEIEDDTPEEDRNRKPPMPQEMIDNLENTNVDELEEYSENAKKTINQMKKALHDERRAKESAQREQQEAINFSQKILEEKQKYANLLQAGEKSYVNSIQNSAGWELKEAKRMVKDAYESGNSDAMVDAQQALQVANLRALQAQNFKLTPIQEDNFKQPPLQERENDVKIQSEPRPDKKAVSWQERNTWFGQDEEMTAAALGLHEKLKNSGVSIGSDNYYAELDKTIRRRFPEQFEEERSQVSKKSSNVVAPATRSTSSNKIKLRSSQVQLAKKLGLTPEQYAFEVRKLENQ